MGEAGVGIDGAENQESVCGVEGVYRVDVDADELRMRLHDCLYGLHSAFAAFWRADGKLDGLEMPGHRGGV